jgi:hypothetical protein
MIPTPRTCSLRFIARAGFALLALLSAAFLEGTAWSQGSAQGCLDREANAFFGRLAAAVLDGTVDPSRIGDEFIAKGTESIVAACMAAGSQASGADVERLRAYMARWTVHLDRRISEIQRAGTPD